MQNTTAAIRRAREMRKAMTPPEIALWARLRGGQLGGLKFRRQHPFGPYILDFFCASAKLAVEVDGALHDRPQQAAHDARRDAYLEQQGVESVRIQARDIRGEMTDVLRVIYYRASERVSRG